MLKTLLFDQIFGKFWLPTERCINFKWQMRSIVIFKPVRLEKQPYCAVVLIIYETKITSTSTNKQYKNVDTKTPSIYPDSCINKRYYRVSFISPSSLIRFSSIFSSHFSALLWLCQFGVPQRLLCREVEYPSHNLRRLFIYLNQR